MAVTEREWAVTEAEEMSGCRYSDYGCCVRALLVASRDTDTTIVNQDQLDVPDTILGMVDEEGGEE